ncbi:MAG: nitroreductase family protein [Bacteroidales bacterium]|nr:nitroreductase family protein [Bacteroidales bacterium]
MINELILRNRSYRRFKETARMTHDQLLKLIDLARLSPSARNQQALKFMLIHEKMACADIFEHLAWAGYLKDWKGPDEGERPAAYIVILGDGALGRQFDTDVGIVAQSMLLGAVEMGFGGCMIGSIKRDKVKKIFSIPDNLSIELIIALGKPAEEIVVEACIKGDVSYWRDENDIHYVPKRSLEDLLWH